MDDLELGELMRLLRRSEAVAPADGLPVSVESLSIARGSEGDELVIHYSVRPLPDGVARQPLPSGQHTDLASYAAEVAEELQAWAIEHVRKYRPLPPFDRDQVRRELPTRDELWRMLRSEFRGVRDASGGFVGNNGEGVEVRVVLTPQQWQEYVVSCEIGCRSDYGVDALSTGDGPRAAIYDLEEVMATMDPDESHLVLDGYRFKGSTRPELPATPGSARKREAEEILRRGGGSWSATYHGGQPSDPFDE